MRCGSCKGEHAHVADVQACYKSSPVYTKECVHGLTATHCTLEYRKPWNWSRRAIHIKYASQCRYCREWMEPGDLAYIRGSMLAHGDCIEDPGAVDPAAMDRRDWTALGIPTYGNVPGTTDELTALADRLLHECIAEELASTHELIAQVELDMGESVADLVLDSLDLALGGDGVFSDRDEVHPD